MKKVLSLFAIFSITVLFSQSYIGFLNDNYSGVHAVINNPANIVDSRFKADINLASGNTFFSNDYASFDFNKLIKGDFNFDTDTEKFISDNNNANLNVDILGPSFMFNIKPKHSVAVFSRLRSYDNANDFNGKVAELIRNNLKSEVPFTSNLGDINSVVQAWGEVGVSYATVLLDKNVHFLKGGLSLKYLQGLIYSKVNGTNLSVDYQTGEDVNLINNKVVASGEVNFSASENFRGIDYILDDLFDNDAIRNSKGFGVDLGFTYEWRPKTDEFKYADNDGNQLYHKDVNKYKLKFGLSVTDIGSISYKNMNDNTYNVNGIVIDEAKIQNLPENYIEAAEKLFGVPVASNTESKGNLPTAIHFNADWNINQKFYLNLDTNFDVANHKTGASIENTYSLTPRFETKWFSAYLPLSYYENSGFNAGFGLRAGPVFVGSGSIITNLINEKSKSLDVYLGLKIPIYQSRPKDSDDDGIFDKVDECPKEAGPKENNGCPWEDKDNDGVTDNIDKCPEVAGKEEFKGCPDTDGDSIQDSEDKCPKIPGVKENKGCPADTDGDGVYDSEDKCPKVPGLKEEQGCPKKAEPAKKVIVITKEAEKTINSYARSIYFNSGKTSFKPGVAEKLDMIVAVMNEYPNANFSIEGHTDSQGKASSNQRLSDRRAKAVLDYLIRRGISSSRLSSYGFGEEYPIDTNKTRAGRANNRRVEIKLRK